MTLRKKTALIIGPVLAGLIAVLFFASRVVLLSSFARLESDQTRRDVDRAVAALSEDLSHLSHECRNAATWDLAYAFVQKPAAGFVKSNIGRGRGSDLAERELNLEMYLTSSGQRVFGEGFDLPTSSELPLPAGLEAVLRPLLVQRNGSTGLEGILGLPDGPMMVAAHPIVPTDGQGPSRGWLVMGRWLDSTEIRRLGSTTHLSLSAERVNGGRLAPDFDAAQIQLGGSKAVVVKPLSSEVIAGYALLRDLEGKPVLLLRADLPRGVYSEGRRSVRYYLGSIVIVGLMFALLTLALLEKTVLARLAALSESVRRVGAARDPSERVSVEGADELAGLAGSINRTLEDLEEARRKRQESEERFGLLVRDLRVGLVVWDPAGKATFSNAAAREILGCSEEEFAASAYFDPDWSFVHEDGSPFLADDRPTRQAILTRQPVRDVVLGLYRHNDLVWLLVNTDPQLDARGTVRSVVCTFNDITPRRRAEQDLRESETRLRSLFENSAVGFYRTTPDGRVLLVNPTLVRMLGCDSAEEVLPRNLESGAFEPDYPREEFRRRLERDGEVRGFEARWVRRDGTAIFVRESARLVREENGAPLYYDGVVEDVTDRKHMEHVQAATYRVSEAASAALNLEALFQSVHEIIQGLMPASNLYIALYDAASDTISFPYFVDQLDPPPSPRKAGRGLTEYVLRTGRPLLASAETLAKLRAQGEILPSGAPPVDWLGVPLKLGDRVIGVMAVQSYDEGLRYGKDQERILGFVSGQVAMAIERRRAEDALKESEERTRLIIDTALDAVITVNESGCVSGWNRRAEEILGWSREEALGLPLTETVVPLQHREHHRRSFAHFLATGEHTILNRRLESTALRRDGSEFPVELSISPARVGGRYTFSVFLRDITARKHAEAEILKAKEAAETACRTKSEFLANMSHEIRTPMNGILGMTELALDGPLAQEQREYLTMVKGSAESLLVIINDVLDFSKAEAGKLCLNESEFDLRQCLQEALRPVLLRAREKGLELIQEVHPDVPFRVAGDSLRLQQILINLVGNAVKFTERGRVLLSAEVESRDEAALSVHFSVSDTGIGIAPEKQRLIFEAFSQADGSTSRKYGGTGLGLTISSRLVEMMEGRLWVESEPGQGAAFHFTARFENAQAIPFEGPDFAHPALPSAPVKEERMYDAIVRPPLNILLAEDHPVNQQIARRLLEKRGHIVAVVADGREAVARVESEAFDLVLMDIQMPFMDGVEATAAIRARERERGGHLPIIAMTAHAMKGDREKYLAAGMDAYLPKPIPREQLWAVVEAIGQKRIGASSAGEESSTAPSNAEAVSEDRLFLSSESGGTARSQVFDRETVLARVEGDTELLQEMASLFLESCPSMLADIQTAVTEGNHQALERAAHLFKGSLANLAADEAWKAAADLEILGRQNRLETAAEAQTRLEQALGRLQPTIEALLEPVAC